MDEGSVLLELSRGARLQALIGEHRRQFALVKDEWSAAVATRAALSATAGTKAAAADPVYVLGVGGHLVRTPRAVVAADLATALDGATSLQEEMRRQERIISALSAELAAMPAWVRQSLAMTRL